MAKKLTTKEFIEKARQIHGNKYDYSKVEYKNSSTKICIICPEHGEFWQVPNDHLRGHGCSKCYGNEKMTIETFIEKARKVHGNKYDYSKVEYTGNNKSKICIICPEHGEFWQKANAHLNGQGCPKCYNNILKTTEQFIKQAKIIHGNKYDYSKVEYKGNKIKICIICPKHGEFWQVPISHLQGYGCQKCALKAISEKNKLSTEEFIEKAKKVHGDKYDYSKVEYIDSKTPVIITCKKHGEFCQIPNYHLSGNGCPKCGIEELIQENKLYELLLNELNCDIIRQKKFKWLKYKNFLKLDFYIPSKKIAIEYQGEQHFKKYRFEKDDFELKERQYRDLKKIELCKKNSIKLLHFSFSEKYCKNWNKYKVYTNINDLITEINGNF